MKTALVAFAALTLLAANARAEGEGAGDPFPFRAGPVATAHPLPVDDTGSMAFPSAAGHAGQATSFANAPVPAVGSEGEVETAASLPRGFSGGAAARTRG